MSDEAGHRVINRTNSGYAAIFVDYENVYCHLRNRYADIPELSDFVAELLMNLQKHLEQKFSLRSIISKAYADYERIKSTPQGSLYQLSDTLQNLADWQRNNLVSDLEFKGAVRMEKRSGIPYDYTVVLLNYNHPSVREMC